MAGRKDGVRGKANVTFFPPFIMKPNKSGVWGVRESEEEKIVREEKEMGGLLFLCKGK